MRALVVVVGAVLAQDRLQMALVQDQHAIQRFAPATAYPSLGDRVRQRRHQRSQNHSGALRLEHQISLRCELRVPIVDQVAKLDAVVFEPPPQLPGLLSHPRLGRFGRTAHCQDPPSRQVNKEEDVEAPEEDRVQAKEVSRDDAFCVRLEELLPAQPGSPRRRRDARRDQNRSDSRRCNRVAQLQQFAAHPEVTPARVFTGHPDDELANLV